MPLSEAAKLRADVALLTDARDVAVECAHIEFARAEAAIIRAQNAEEERDRLRVEVAVLKGERC